MCWSADQQRAALSSSGGSGASGYASDVSRELPEVPSLRTLTVTLACAKCLFSDGCCSSKLGRWPRCLSRSHVQRLQAMWSQPQHGSKALAGSAPVRWPRAVTSHSCVAASPRDWPELPAVSALLCQVVSCIQGSIHSQPQPVHNHAQHVCLAGGRRLCSMLGAVHDSK